MSASNQETSLSSRAIRANARQEVRERMSALSSQPQGDATATDNQQLINTTQNNNKNMSVPAIHEPDSRVPDLNPPMPLSDPNVSAFISGTTNTKVSELEPLLSDRQLEGQDLDLAGPSSAVPRSRVPSLEELSKEVAAVISSKVPPRPQTH